MRCKNVEFLTRCFQHSIHKFVYGNLECKKKKINNHYRLRHKRMHFTIQCTHRPSTTEQKKIFVNSLVTPTYQTHRSIVNTPQTDYHIEKTFVYKIGIRLQRFPDIHNNQKYVSCFSMETLNYENVQHIQCIAGVMAQYGKGKVLVEFVVFIVCCT